MAPLAGTSRNHTVRAGIFPRIERLPERNWCEQLNLRRPVIHLNPTNHTAGAQRRSGSRPREARLDDLRSVTTEAPIARSFRAVRAVGAQSQEDHGQSQAETRVVTCGHAQIQSAPADRRMLDRGGRTSWGRKSGRAPAGPGTRELSASAIRKALPSISVHR